MRIIYWIGGVGDKFGGLERYNVLLAEECKKRNYPLVIMHDKPNTIAQYSQRLIDAKTQFVVIGNTLRDPFHAIPNSLHFVKSWKPDIVHTHFVNPVVLPLLKILGIPLLYQTYHTGIDHRISLKTRVIRWMVQICTKRVLAVSERMKSDISKAGVHPSHIKTLPLGLSIRDFLEAASFSKEQIPPGYNDLNKKIVITVGRFFSEKGMRYVVEAAVEVVGKHPNVIWWFVGKDGPEKEYCVSLVMESGLADRIYFLGERNDVSFLMTRAYIQVVGSLYEGLPLMTLESSAFGVPTIGTQIGGLDEVVIDGITGILVPRCSSLALAEATLKLLDDKILRDIMGRAAKEHLWTNYNAEILVNELLDTYENDFDLLRKKK